MSHVRIPKSDLRAQLDAAEAIKQAMTGLFQELEQSAGVPASGGHANSKPGAWRHRETRRPT